MHFTPLEKKLALIPQKNSWLSESLEHGRYSMGFLIYKPLFFGKAAAG
jgi:hypothetical protein